MKVPTILRAVVVAAFALGAQVSNAATYNYTFDTMTACTPTSCPGVGSGPWASLSFADIGANSVRMIFSMENLAAHAGVDMVANAWDKHLFLNYAGGPSLSGLSFSAVANTTANKTLFGATQLLSGAIARTSNSFTNGTIAQQGKYDIDIVFSGNALNPNEKSVYNIAGSGLTASMFNTLSSGTGNTYYAGIEILQSTSSPGFDARIAAHPVAAIPEPGTYAMMLAGLGLMGFIARRRKQSAAA